MVRRCAETFQVARKPNRAGSDAVDVFEIARRFCRPCGTRFLADAPNAALKRRSSTSPDSVAVLQSRSSTIDPQSLYFGMSAQIDLRRNDYTPPLSSEYRCCLRRFGGCSSDPPGSDRKSTRLNSSHLGIS